MKVNQKYGYVRVSSKSEQDNSSIEGQKKELIRNEIPKKNIRVEVGSAADSIQNWPKFQHLIEHELEENDLLMVTKLDRCSRSTLEFLKLQDALLNEISLLSPWIYQILLIWPPINSLLQPYLV